MKTRRNKINSLIDQEYQEGVQNGLSQGLLALERVVVWMKSEKELLNPNGLEKIIEWAEADVAKLKGKLTDE